MRETATIHAGGIVMWLRATDAGTVLLYAARGMRTPFGQPSILSADDTDRWATIAASLIATADGAVPLPIVRASASGRSAAVFGGGDVVLDLPSTDLSPAVVVHIGATGPQALTATLSDAVLRDVVPALRETARVAREMAATKLAAAGVSARVGVRATAIATATATARAARSMWPSAAATGAVPKAVALNAATPVVRSAAPAAAASAVIERTLASDAPRAGRVTGIGAGTSAAALAATTPPGVPGPASPSPTAVSIAHVATVAPALATGSDGARIVTTRTAPPAAASANLSAAIPLVDRGAAAVHSATEEAATGPVLSGDPSATRSGGLPSSAVGTVVRQRQPLLAYCYTAFGLTTDSALTGRATVRIALNPAGQVIQADIVDRHWWGRGSDRVESCVQARVRGWRFPAAPRESTHDFQLYFNH